MDTLTLHQANYFKIAFRNLLKYKGYSFINIFGLATGMAVAMLIGLWVSDELSFNKNFKNHDRIGRITVHNGEGTYMTNPIPLAADLRASYGSDFKYIAMTTSTQKYAILSGDKKFFQSGSFMQPDAPELFGLDMVHGTRAALKDPHSVLLSESLAKKLFGDENPLDKIVKIKNRMEAKVAGVYKDLPKNSEFQDLTFIGPWDLLASFMSFMKEQENDWNDNSYKIYVQLAPQVDFAGVSAKIKDIKRKHLDAKRVAYNPELFVEPANLSQISIQGDSYEPTTFLLPPELPMVSPLRATPFYFNPSAGETVEITVRVNKACWSYVEIVEVSPFDTTMTQIRVLRDVINQPAGPDMVIWDGRSNGGEIVPAKAYGMRITVQA